MSSNPNFNPSYEHIAGTTYKWFASQIRGLIRFIKQKNLVLVMSLAYYYTTPYMVAAHIILAQIQIQNVF